MAEIQNKRLQITVFLMGPLVISDVVLENLFDYCADFFFRSEERILCKGLPIFIILEKFRGLKRQLFLCILQNPCETFPFLLHLLSTDQEIHILSYL